MQGKVQKHQAFEAELSANQSRIDTLQKAGQELIDANHYASDEVSARMNEVISLWKRLLEATEMKGQETTDVLYRSYDGLAKSSPAAKPRKIYFVENINNGTMDVCCSRTPPASAHFVRV